MAPRKRNHLTVPRESRLDEETDEYLHSKMTKTTNRLPKFQPKDTHFFDESRVPKRPEKRTAKESFYLTKIIKKKNGPPDVVIRRVFSLIKSILKI